jgi:hypothetical protein
MRWELSVISLTFPMASVTEYLTFKFGTLPVTGADGGPRAQMGEDRAAYRREGGPGGADKRGDAGAGTTQSFQFVRSSDIFHRLFSRCLVLCLRVNVGTILCLIYPSYEYKVDV